MMKVLFRTVSEPHECAYLPDQRAELVYEFVAGATAAEYSTRMMAGWRRFGHAIFQPVCGQCRACQSLRVVVDHFRPNRSQRRAMKANADLDLIIGPPKLDRERLDLYDKYHSFQNDFKGWPHHEPKDPRSYVQSFLDNPFPTEEWAYRLDGRLVGIGYVDHLPEGLSAIYFFYDPDLRPRSTGTANVLRLIQRASELGLPHVYLGYYVKGCGSLEYKASFVPNQILTPDGVWTDFRTGASSPS